MMIKLVLFFYFNGKIEIVLTTTNYEPWWGFSINDEKLRECVKRKLESFSVI